MGNERAEDDGAARSASDPAKQIKVKLPIEVILRLQEIRITEGRTVAEVVTAALHEYLQRNYKSKRPPSSEDRDNQLVPEHR